MKYIESVADKSAMEMDIYIFQSNFDYFILDSMFGYGCLLAQILKLPAIFMLSQIFI
ncbi:hypothetical protein [Paenibacillus psychroresistens]|uniref:hypothetical protein n=1 Tax=Paenibacillus psychroresistens TaxID=1778678 RepID=UPI0013917CC4|nr:hypothetical protein [Paenibacillus psychroresistens]